MPFITFVLSNRIKSQISRRKQRGLKLAPPLQGAGYLVHAALNLQAVIIIHEKKAVLHSNFYTFFYLFYAKILGFCRS